MSGHLKRFASRAAAALGLGAALLAAPIGSKSALAERGLHAQGRLSLARGAAADLDRARLYRGPGADIAYARGDHGGPVLAPSGTVWIGLLGDRRPDKAACLRASFSQTPVRMHRLRPARYFCVRTSEGRMSALRVLRAPKRRSDPLLVEMRTFRGVVRR